MPEPTPGTLLPLFHITLPGPGDPPCLGHVPPEESTNGDGTLLLGGGDGHLYGYDLSDIEGSQAPRCLWRSPDSQGGWLTDLALVPGGAGVVTSDKAGQLWLRSPKGGAGIASFEGHGAWVFSVAPSPDGTRFASAGDDGLLKVWRLGSPDPILTLPFTRVGELPPREATALGGGRPAGLYALDWSPDGAFICVGDFEGYITLIEAWTGAVRWRRRGLDDIPWALAFSPDGAYIALGTGHRCLGIMSSKTGALRRLGGKQEGATPGVTWLGPLRVVSGGEGGGISVRRPSGVLLGEAPFPDESLWRLAGYGATGLILSTHPGGICRGWRWKDAP